jgi:hypothetical protein
MWYRDRMIPKRRASRLSLVTVALGLTHWALAAGPPATNLVSDSSSTVGPLILSGKQSSRPAGKYSTGIADVIKMLDARMEPQVILGFIENSVVPYNPDAADLLALKEHGASTELLTVLLHRSDQLRVQFPVNQIEAAPQPAEVSVVALPDNASGEMPLPDSAAPESAEGPDPGTVYTFAYYWPWLCQTPVCNSYRPYPFEHGCWRLPRGEARQIAEGFSREGTTVGSPDPQGVRATPVVDRGQRRSVPSHAARSRSIDRSGVRSGGRSR